jgi:hypothetical protein
MLLRNLEKLGFSFSKSGLIAMSLLSASQYKLALLFFNDKIDDGKKSHEHLPIDHFLRRQELQIVPPLFYVNFLLILCFDKLLFPGKLTVFET